MSFSTAPVLITLKSSVNYTSKCSMEVGVRIESENPLSGKIEHTASAYLTFVALNDNKKPMRIPEIRPDTDKEKYRFNEGEKSYDINLEVAIQPENGTPSTVSKSNFKYMYWNMSQQLAHHTVNGCPVNSGDMMGSGTISGKTPDSYGSMLELSWRGEKPVKLNDGSERKFINDNDTVIMTGFCDNGTTKIGFGEVSTKLLPVWEKA